MKFRIFVYLLFLGYKFAYSQNTIGLPQVVNFTTNNYKAGAQTWDIKQDKWGRMYFANNEGLLTFDGNFWRIFALPNKSILRSIAIDSVTNRIYVGGQDEIGYFSPDLRGELKFTSIKQLIPKPQNQFADIWDIELHKGSVFFRLSDRIFEYRQNNIKVYPAVSAWLFLKEVSNRLLAQDKEKGIYEFKQSAWSLISNTSAYASIEVTGMASLNGDSLLIGTLKNGIFYLSNGILSKTSIRHEVDFTNNHIYDFKPISSNEFVAATTTQGCFIINSKGQLVQKITRSDGLQNNNVLCSFIDRDKNIWTGLNNGISFIAYNDAIKYIKPSSSNEVSCYGVKVFNNKLYIAASDGAYFCDLNFVNNDLSFSIGHFNFLQNSADQAWRFDEVNANLFLGHHNGNFIVKNGIAQSIYNQSGSWLSIPMSNIFPSKYVLSGTYNGLSLLTFDGNVLKSSEKLKGLNESLRFLAMDNYGAIWASHPYRGVYKIILDTVKKAFTSKLFTDKDGLPSTFRNHVYKISNHVVVATENGIYEFDETKQQFAPSPFLYKAFGDIRIQYLNEDAEGNIWFCSSKKLGVLLYQNGTKTYSTHWIPELTGKFLTGFENIYPFNANNVFIASDNGIIHLNTEKYLAEELPIKVLLSKVSLINNKDSIVFGGFQNPTYKEDIRISKFAIDNNAFHFEFSVPNFANPTTVLYSYKLEGYDKEWSDWTNKTEKDYTNLSDGQYIFSVKVKNNLGKESAITTYSFSIKPAWYNSFGAYFMYVGFILWLIYGLNKRQKNRLIKQKIKYEEEQKRQQYIYHLEIEKNEKEIIRLQNEKLVSEVRGKTKELADANMHLVERNDALQKVKTELQRLYKKSDENHDIKKTIQLLNDIEKNNHNWEQFASHFDEVNNHFLKNLKSQFPKLTVADLKLCTYLHLKLSSKEIAQLMNISVRGVEIGRYRLRKKLGISQDVNLVEYLNL